GWAASRPHRRRQSRSRELHRSAATFNVAVAKRPLAPSRRCGSATRVSAASAKRLIEAPALAVAGGLGYLWSRFCRLRCLRGAPSGRLPGGVFVLPRASLLSPSPVGQRLTISSL